MRQKVQRIFKSKLPPNVTEEMIREDHKKYKLAVKAHSKTVGIPAPLYRYGVSETLSEKFVVVPDPKIVEPEPIDPIEVKNAELEGEVNKILLSQLEPLLDWVANMPDSPRKFNIARSEIALKRKQIVR